MEQETDEADDEPEPELEPIPDVSREERDVHSQNVEVVSDTGASLLRAETDSFTEGVDVLRSWCPSGESDKKLGLTSSRSDPLELTEVTLRASPLSPPLWYGRYCAWSKDFEWDEALLQPASVS